MVDKTIDRNACAYKEIYEILKIFPKELVDKVPKEKIEFFYNNMDKNYNYEITKETFDEITMLEETVAIFTILFRDYWSTDEQKKKILNFQKQAEAEIEKENAQKYNLDNIFKKKNKNINGEYNNIVNEEKSLIEIKETPFRKIINVIKRFLHIN